MLEESNKKSFQTQKKDVPSKSSDYDRYKTLFESINAAAFITTLDGKIKESNLRCCDLFGYGWEEFNQMNIESIFPENVDWRSLLEEIISKGGMNFESQNIRKNGTKFPVAVDTSLFTLDKKPVLLSLVWDITDRKLAEVQLRESEQRYRCIFDNSAVAIMLTDDRERIVSWNKYTETLLNMGEDELLNKPVSMLYPPQEWAKIRSERIREKGMQHHLESKMYTKNQSLIDVDISVSVLKNDKNEICGSIGVIKNITEQKKAEKLIKESEAKFRGLFDRSTDGMLVLDARGEILDVNSKIIDFFNLPRDQLIGKNFLSMGLLTPKSLSVVVSQFQELLSNRISTAHETEVYDKKGETIDVELSSFFLVKQQDEVDNFVLVIRDIRDRKTAEINLSREHGLLHTLMDSIPDSIYFKDENNRFIKVNKAKAAHSNVKPEDMIGKTDFEFLPEEEARRAFDDDQEILNTGKFIINKVEKLTCVDGSTRWVSVTKIPRFDAEGNIIGTMGISRDITELKKLEAKL
jgi:PAS domain S-box-containing protein